jgi:sn-glycerol 3-phosphate transport system ATP-binding protein
MAGTVRIPLEGCALSAGAPKKIILGVRPEHLELNGGREGGIELAVDHVELLGADTLVHGHFGETKVSLIMRLPDIHRIEKHGTVRLLIPPEKLHLFDAESKKRI